MTNKKSPTMTRFFSPESSTTFSKSCTVWPTEEAEAVKEGTDAIKIKYMYRYMFENFILF